MQQESQREENCKGWWKPGRKAQERKKATGKPRGQTDKAKQKPVEPRTAKQPTKSERTNERQEEMRKKEKK
jgi:hypothetical protein